MTSEAGKENAPASVKEIWEKTILRFQERTGQRLDGVSRRPDDLRRLLDAHYAAQADGQGVSKAKATGFQVIQCIQLLGGIASQGASMAFAPAGLCFNALSFLLDIPKKVHEFHGEVDAIFAEVGPALAHFRIYERMEDSSQLNEALLLSIYQVMTSLVNLCAVCINIHHEGRWKGFKRNAKRILLDDGSVQGELANFKKLTQDQLNVQATLTLEAAVETGLHVKFITATTREIDTNTQAIKSDVSGLMEAENKRTLDANRKHILATIKNKLGLKEDAISAVIAARDNMWSSAVKNTGKWLNGIDAYKQWLDSNSASQPILALTGGRGTGKSFLVSAIAAEIKSANLPTKAERRLIGYYSFGVREKEGADGDRRQPEAAIKSICVQLAEQDLAYARRISTVCSEQENNEKYFRDATCKELSVMLGIGMPGESTMHYILLDSVDTLSEKDRERLMGAIRQSNPGASNRVRVLNSGEPAAFQQDHLRLSRSTTVVDITSYNEVDIKAYIMEELQRAVLFQGADDDSQRRRKIVEERLLARSDNSYYTVQHDMRKVKDIVESGGTEEELSRELHESSTDPRLQVLSDIEVLEATLKPREIEEINELLVWIVAGFEWMVLEKLEAALFLRFKAVSLQSLKDKIIGKYSRIFTLEFNGRSMALKDHVRDCVVVHRDKPRGAVDDPKITATINIANADLKLVQRFFWDLNHHSFLGGFSFQPADDTTKVGQRKIQVNEVDAHLQIVKRSFEFLRQEVIDSRGEELGGYLIRCIPSHLEALSEVTGLDELQIADKQFIGSSVYDIFYDDNIIERIWIFSRGCADWFDDNDKMNIFWKWLDDPVAISLLGPRDKRWLADLKKEKHRNSKLLTRFMTMAARNWLRKTEWHINPAFQDVRAFVTLSQFQSAKPEPGEQASMSSETEDSDDNVERYMIGDHNRTPEIAVAEQWCKQVLGVTEVDYTWCMRLGDTYAFHNDNATASEHYKKAATILQTQDPDNKEQLQDAFKALGRHANDPKSALIYLEEASKLDVHNAEILHSMFHEYVDSGKEDEARSIIQRALANKPPGTESELLVVMLTRPVMTLNEKGRLSVFRVLFSLISSSAEWSTVFQNNTEIAVETARQNGNNEELAILLLQLGSARYYLHKESPEKLARAARDLRECLDTARENDTLKGPDPFGFIQQSANALLSMTYLEAAMRSGGEEIEASMEGLRQLLEQDPRLLGPKSIIATLYLFKGQRHKAHDIFRSDMAKEFDILVGNIFNIHVGAFVALRNILNRTGDYKNALRAALLIPKWQFDDTVIEELLITQEPSLELASTELVQFYQKKFRRKNKYWDIREVPLIFQEVCMEAKRLASEAEVDSERAACYHKAQKILDRHGRGRYWGISCTNCKRYWDYDIGLHACKYCYKVDLCDMCWNELRSGEPAIALICSRTHEWYDLPPLTVEQYFRACKNQVLITNDNGDEEVVSVSKWLGMLCEEWGMSKADWGFE